MLSALLISNDSGANPTMCSSPVDAKAGDADPASGSYSDLRSGSTTPNNSEARAPEKSPKLGVENTPTSSNASQPGLAAAADVWCY
jgi:hypothetical protein